MTKSGPNFASEDQMDRKVPVDRENTLKMVRGDYEEPWKGVIREAIQNAADAWGRNIGEGILEDDSELLIEINLDTKDRIFTYRDNAGGMSKATLEENLVGIDTPDEVKDRGDSVGSYGRGFHVIASVGSGLTYVESKQKGDHYSVTLDKTGQYSEPEHPDEPQLDRQGTYIQVLDVVEHDIDGKLGNWDAVEDVLLENFNFLLLEPDVTVEYAIDRRKFHPEPINLYKYKSEGELRVVDSLEEFTHSGSTYHIQDLVVVRSDVVDSDPPWEGIAMLKGNEYLDHPFMTVQTYKPHNIRSLNKPAKMFGWCNANDLCPDLENNAHTKFSSPALGKSGLKEKLRDIHNDHFRREQKTNEREELRGDITDHINELLISFEDFEDYQIPSTGVEIPGGESQEDAGVGPMMTGSEAGYSIVCQAGQRDFEIGGNVPLQVAIENPESSDIKKFEIFDIRVTSDVLEGDINFPDQTVEVGPNETKVLKLSGFQPSEDGTYVFRAKGRPTDQEGPVQDANVYVRAGDVDPKKGSAPGGDGKNGDNNESPNGNGGGSGESTTRQVAIVEGVSLSPDSEDDYKAALERGEQGGFEVLINTDRPEWMGAEEIEDDSRRKTLQERLGTIWGIQQIVLAKNVDDIEELVSSNDPPGDIADELINRLYERDDLMAEIEAIISSEHGVGYE